MAAGSFLTEKYGPLPGWGWGAVAGGAVVLYRLYKARQAGGSSSPTSMNVTAAPPAAPEPTASLTTPGGFQYSGPLSGLANLIPQGAMSATAAPSAPAAAASATSPFNPYPVGTVVAPTGENIVQAIPTSTGYVDVTNMGGLYTTGQAPSGSAYSGQAGNYSAAVQGNTIYEYTPTGVQQFQLK